MTANKGTEFVAPEIDSTQVLYGAAYLMTASYGCALPADIDLGDHAKYEAVVYAPGSWKYVGATDEGVQITFNPSQATIRVEEQVTPVATPVESAEFTIEFAMAEETLEHIKLAYGGAGTIATVAAGVGQPAKETLTLSRDFPYLACVLVGKNDLGFPRVLHVPRIQSAGQVQTSYRRAADKRMFPTTLNALCDLSDIDIIDITAAAT